MKGHSAAESNRIKMRQELQKKQLDERKAQRERMAEIRS